MYTALRNVLNYTRRTLKLNSKTTKHREMGDHAFPKTLRDFGYAFDQGGKLKKIDEETGQLTENGFEFNVSDDLAYNQKRYEALGEIIDEYVYELLEKEVNLQRLPVPKSSQNPELRTFVFGTDDFSLGDKLLILIHGSGVVRAGQWARRLIINDNLDTGTQLPYIKKGRELGYGVLVLNTNDNFRVLEKAGEKKKTEIPGSADPHSHVDTVWKEYVAPSNAKHVAIVAHSYGGVCVVKLAMEHAQDFQKRVFAVGLTDSVHTIPSSATNTKEILKVVARNWVSSEKPLDTPESTMTDDIDRYSAGHSTHEMTSASSIESVFRFLEDRYEEVKTRSNR